MPTTVQAIIDRASSTLNDIGLVRWIQSDMIKAINDAEQSVLESRPDLFETNASMALVSGPRQTPPSDCYHLMDVIYNVTAADVPISSITQIKRSDLDKCRADWMLDDPMKLVQHWMQDDRERSVFYVYPSQPTAGAQLGRVQIRYSKRPTALSGVSENLNVPEEMINAVYYFVVMRMLERDEKFAGSPQAERFMGMFAQMVSAKDGGEDTAEAYRASRE